MILKIRRASHVYSFAPARGPQVEPFSEGPTAETFLAFPTLQAAHAFLSQFTADRRTMHSLRALAFKMGFRHLSKLQDSDVINLIASLISAHRLSVIDHKRPQQLSTSSGPPLSWWVRLINQLDLAPPRDRGALWSKVSEDVAEALAKRDGRVTLEMLLQKTQFFAHYNRVFGNRKTERTAEVWEELSRRYARSLQGRVVAYVDDFEFFRSISTEKKLPQLTAEFEEIASVMESNANIDMVIVKDVFGGEPVTMTRTMVLRASKTLH